jgi:hypothetical protein
VEHPFAGLAAYVRGQSLATLLMGPDMSADGQMNSGLAILSRALPAQPAASAAPMCGRTSIVMDKPSGRRAVFLRLSSLTLAVEKQPCQTRPERKAQEHPPPYDFEREHRTAFRYSQSHQRNEAFFGSGPGANLRFWCPKCGSQPHKKSL